MNKDSEKTKMSKSALSKIIVCPYCRKQIRKRDSQRDHVPPKSIFSNPKPLNLKTVRCCAKCHREESRGDEVLKVIAALGLMRSRYSKRIKSEASRALARSSWWRLALENSARNAKRIQFKLGDEQIQAAAITLPDSITIPLDGTVRRIAIGLLFLHNPSWDASNHSFKVHQIGEHELTTKLTEVIEVIGPLRYHLNLQEQVFCAAWDFFEGDPDSGVLVMSFFGGLVFFVTFSSKCD